MLSAGSTKGSTIRRKSSTGRRRRFRRPPRGRYKLQKNTGIGIAHAIGHEAQCRGEDQRLHRAIDGKRSVEKELQQSDAHDDRRKDQRQRRQLIQSQAPR